MDKIALSWSGGKDCAFALHLLLQNPHISVERLLTTVTAPSGKVPMHETASDLISRQAAATCIIHDVIKIPDAASNSLYRSIINDTYQLYIKKGLTGIAYADIFLEDIRAFRELDIQNAGLRGFWPLWGKSTEDVAKAFIQEGFQAVVVSVDASKLSPDFVGQNYDADFLKKLPPMVDPCGENGEFHTFVFDGPIFQSPIPLEKGPIFTTMDGRFVHIALQRSR